MKNRAVCRALVCALTLTMVAPPTIAQQYIDPLTQRFDQAPTPALAQTTGTPSKSEYAAMDTQPRPGARTAAGPSGVNTEAERQSKAQATASKVTSFGPVAVATVLAIALATIYVRNIGEKDRTIFDDMTAGTTGTTGTR